MKYTWELAPGFWGDCDSAAKKSIGFVVALFEKYISSSVLESQLIIAGSGSPKACPRRHNTEYFRDQYPDNQLDYLIYVSSVPMDTQSLVFQFAHELGHVLMDCYPETEKHKWISECICEMLSLFALYAVDETNQWNTICQMEDSTTNYVNNMIEMAEVHFSLEQLNISDLESDPYGPLDASGIIRVRNMVIAKYLYPAIKTNPLCLKSIVSMRNFVPNISCKDFILTWADQCIDKTLPLSFLALVDQILAAQAP